MSGSGATALVTGAGGFIGSHLCERLVTENMSVRAMCRYTSRNEIGSLRHVADDRRSEIEILFGDLLDEYFVRRALAGVETVFHLGASISVPYSYVAPRQVIATNVAGTLNVLLAARDAEARRVVHLSSSEVYGTAQMVPIDERHPLHPQSPYAASKVGADKLAESFNLSFELPVVIARPFNTFGPRQSLRAVIPTVVAQAVAGDRIAVGNTAPTRDFVYVADTVDALWLLGSSDAGAGETFNIATGVDIAVGSVVDLVGELLGRELAVVVEEERLRPPASEVYRLLGDATKIREVFGWEPLTPFRDGVRNVIDWMEHNASDPSPAYAV